MRLLPALALAALLAAPASLASDLPDPGPVVAAERAFAEETGRIGIDRGFLKHSSPDAILINARVARVVDVMDAGAVEQPPAPSLVWFPIWAGVSRSGDLGFTSGPIEIGGRRGGSYFTIWKRQADGSWKWIYDGGVGAASKDDPGPDSRPVFLPTSTSGAGTAAAAMSEVGRVEAELARRAATDQKAAHLAVFAADGRLHVAPFAPARDPQAVAALLNSYSPAIRFAAQGGGASDAGDLAWTYGTAQWSAAGAAKEGHYVRVWQKRADGWKLVFAQILPGAAAST